MRKKSLRFLCILVCCALFAAAALSAAAFCIDPQNVYRRNTKGLRVYNPLYSAAGSIAHFDYDTLIIGSSMVQNWDADALAQLLSCKPLKATVGAMTPSEALFLLAQARQAGKARHVILNIDPHRIAAAESVAPDAGRFPSYQFSPHGISQFQYLLGFTTWFEFIPADLLLTATQRLPLRASLRQKIDESTDINRMCVWDETHLMENDWQDALDNAQDAFNEGDPDAFVPHETERLHALFACLADAADDGMRITLVLPPYSMLYWCRKTPEQTQTLLALRAELARLADDDARITLVDLQSMDETTDLSYYVDSVHCGEALRLKTQASLADSACTADEAAVAEHNRLIRTRREQILQNTES